MITLVYGGSGCGKSEYAEQLVLSCADMQERYYLATMIAYGKEGKARVERHRKLRAGKGFTTIECPVTIESVLSDITKPSAADVLLECVSNLVANEMFDCVKGEENLVQRVICGLELLCDTIRHLVIVTNNIFEDGMEYEDTTRRYAAYLGEVNAWLARKADRVVEIVAGVPVQPGNEALSGSVIPSIGRAPAGSEDVASRETVSNRSCIEQIKGYQDLLLKTDTDRGRRTDRGEKEKENSNGKRDDRDNKDRDDKMRLIIGGYAQGKLTYAIGERSEGEYLLLDENQYQNADGLFQEMKNRRIKALDVEPYDRTRTTAGRLSGNPCSVIINHFHLIIRNINDQGTALSWIHQIKDLCVQNNMELIVICDELGCGIVPADYEERRWRENTGRILCSLAQESDQVVRILCGIAQVIRNGNTM